MSERLEELQDQIEPLKESDKKLGSVLEIVCHFLEQSETTRTNGEVKGYIRRMEYKLHDELVIKGDGE
jgi:hypothetical protein